MVAGSLPAVPDERCLPSDPETPSCALVDVNPSVSVPLASVFLRLSFWPSCSAAPREDLVSSISARQALT